MEPWVENVLRPKPVSRDVALPPGKLEWTNITKAGGTFEKDPQFFTSVFAPAALGLTPEEAEELLQVERKAEEVSWKKKVIVDDPNFRAYFRSTMRKAVHPLERSESMLKSQPNRPQFTDHGKFGKKGNTAVRQAPISMLAGEPYDDPRDFTLDLKKNVPEENVGQIANADTGIMEAIDFDRYSGLNVKTSLLPAPIITKPLRGEGGAESRRRILGMGGMIEPIRSEERTQFHFGAKM